MCWDVWKSCHRGWTILDFWCGFKKQLDCVGSIVMAVDSLSRNSELLVCFVISGGWRGTIACFVGRRSFERACRGLWSWESRTRLWNLIPKLPSILFWSTRSPSWTIDTVIQNIHPLTAWSLDCSFVYVWREANRPANWLASWARNSSFDCNWPLDLPPDLSFLDHIDTNESGFIRLVSV